MKRKELSLQAKIFAITGIASVAFVAAVAVNVVLADRVDLQLTAIQERYLPKVELKPELEGHFLRIRHSFQDAVASGDADELATAHEAHLRFLADLEAAHGALDPREADVLRAALDAYLASASDVARRLMARETGEGVVDAEKAMQDAQSRVEAEIDQVASLDRRALAAAFATAARAERVARAAQIWIGATCLVTVLFLTFAVSRGVVRTVSAIEAGLRRFGTGDFGVPISTESRDELGRVARYANLMAQSLEELGRERLRAEAALRLSNRELEAFSYSVAHDLRAPLRGINGFSHALLDDYAAALDEEGKGYLLRIAAAAERMGHLIDALLTLARVSRAELHRERVDLTQLATAAAGQLRAAQPEREVTFFADPDVVAEGDPVLLRAVLDNLVGNAWKFTGRTPEPRVVFGVGTGGGEPVYYVRDNGAGFDMAYADKLFRPFQRLHTSTEFAGTGIGLATVERIVQRHGGRIWAEGRVGAGAIFHFTLPSHSKGAHA